MAAQDPTPGVTGDPGWHRERGRTVGTRVPMERVGVLLLSGVLVVVERIVVGVLYRPVVRRPDWLAVVPLGVQ